MAAFLYVLYINHQNEFDNYTLKIITTLFDILLNSKNVLSERLK